MNAGPTELLVLRLALIAIVFVFVIVAAAVLRSGLRARELPAAVPSRAVRARQARLVVVAPASSGLPPGVEIALGGRMTLGRDDDSSIVIPDGSVSGQHALIEQARGGWVVRDLGSTNGTFVNGRAIDGRPVALRDNAHVAFGTVVFRFRA